MHPYRYDGSPGPYQALLERLSTMGEPQGVVGNSQRNSMPGWRDPFPFAGQGQLDAHLFDLQRMAERDQPRLHEDDDLTQTLGGHAISGASSTMHCLASRHRSLEIIEQRAKWLATYLTPERLDEAEIWRDQMERRKAQAREVGSHQGLAQKAMRSIRLSIQHGYADCRAALAAWDKLVADPETGGLTEAAKQVSADPSILGELKGGKTWLGMGRDNDERLRARGLLLDLEDDAIEYQHHDALAQNAEREYKAMDPVPRAEGELAETLAAMRDVKHINLHYMLNLQDKVVASRALLASRDTDPVATLAASHALYQELRSNDNPGERITGTQLKKAMVTTMYQVRHDPALSEALAAKGLSTDTLFTEATATPAPGPKRVITPAPSAIPGAPAP